jgi:DNA-binding transcriptional LysR family regulator
VQLTDVGEGYLLRAKEILAKLEDADNFVQDRQQNPKGKLKINAPMALGLTDLSSLFADFMQAYPEIELDIHLGDESVDLVEQGFDLGFRASSRPVDSNYVGRPLKHFNYCICVGSNYFKQQKKINQPEDLLEHNCFIYSYFQGKNVWPINGGISVNGNLRVNSTVFMMEAIKRSQGVGFIPDFVCREALNNGEVIEILADTQKPQLTLYALYPARHYLPTKLVQCIEFLEQWFAKK